MRFIPFVGCLIIGPLLAAADYHIDFAGGDDSSDGLTPATAWKHAPGDVQATGLPATTVLRPGDRLLLKGGVAYAGTIGVSASGTAAQPVIVDGGAWGSGKAIIQAGTPVPEWRPCSSQDEAGGNPHWRELVVAEVPRPKTYGALNLCDDQGPLPVAQHPNPADFAWQEHHGTWFNAAGILRAPTGPTLRAEPGFRGNSREPLARLLTGGTAVVGPIPGAAFTYALPGPIEVHAVAIAVQPKYLALREVTVLADGVEVLRVDLAKDDSGKDQRFALPRPVTATRVGFRFGAAHDAGDWGKLRRVSAFDGEGRNLLDGADHHVFSDAANLVPLGGGRPGWTEGMTFAYHAGNNHIFYKQILGDDGAGTLTLPVHGDSQYDRTRWCLFNSVKLIDTPGEHSVDLSGDGPTVQVFLWPRGGAVDLWRSERAIGLSLEGASHVQVRNLDIRQANKHGISVRGPARSVMISDCELSRIRGSVALTGSKIDGILLERLHIHDNPGHTKGIVLHTCTQAVTRDCRLVRNTSTALDYYACSDGQVVGNTVLENRGSHANGLTFYVGCKDILVERNHVAEGNCALTFQEAERMTFRNNLFDSNGRSAVVGIWTAGPLRDIRIINNTIVGSQHQASWAVGLFSNNRAIEGLVVANNIIDGAHSDHGIFRKGTFRNNLYTRLGPEQGDHPFGADELVETDLTRIFRDPAAGDYRLKPGSPAIAAGADGATDDITGAQRPPGRCDLGAFAFTP